MKKSRFFSAVLFVGLLFALLPAPAKAMWDVPVAPGGTFRWVFVTSEKTDALSDQIEYYNQFVNDAADIGTSISGVVGKSTIAEIDWKAIASTPTTNAIDNIVGSSTPIYNPLGTLVANGTSDMFDGSLESSISITETGGEAYVNMLAFTGTQSDGTTSQYCMMGTPYGNMSVCGYPNGTSWIWISGATYYKGNTAHIYAISEELTVVPLPSALMLAATGLLSSTLGLKRLRRRHQE